MRRTPSGLAALTALAVLVASVAGALGMTPAVAQTAPTTDVDATAAVVALESEVLGLVELGAFHGPVPPELGHIHDTWRSSLSGLDHDGLVGWVIDADGRGAVELAALRSAGASLTPAIERALGALGDANVDALRVGRPIDIGADEYRAAFGNLNAIDPGVVPPPPAAARTAAQAQQQAAAQAQAQTEPQAQATDTGDGSTPWWVWVLVALGVSLVVSILVGRLLKRASLAYPPVDGRPERGDEVARLLEAARRLSACVTPSDVAGVAVDEAVQLTIARHAAFVAAPDTPTGAAVLAEHPRSRLDPTWLHGGAIGRVLATGQAERSVLVDEVFGPEPVAVVVVPVVRSGRLVGALCVDREPTRPFAAGTQEALSRLAPLVAGALDAAERHDGMTSMSLTDGLTSLANRRRLDRYLPAALGRGHGSVGFLMIDVDHFKAYNDANGHVAGDDVLRRVAEVLASQVRPSDIVYRYGGEEFCVLLADATPAEAALVAERVRSGVEAVDFPGAASQPSGRVTVSVGLAVAEASDPLEITERADRALYAAKHAGRNRVEVSAGA